MNNSIKNILFDLGNVILDIDYDIMDKRMTELTGLQFPLTDQESWDTFYKYEKGKIPYVVFFNYITKISKKKAIINDLLPAWNSMLLEIQKETWDHLLKLSEHYNLYLLSNTNEIHLDWFEKYLKSNYSLEEWNSKIFTRVYYSHLIGHRKPDLECFEFILNDASIKGHETVFIDDVTENIEGARAAGLQAFQYDRHDIPFKQFVDHVLSH